MNMRLSGGHTEAVMAQVRSIPQPRWAWKITKSLFGLAFMAGAGLAAWKLSWPWYVVVPVALFGAHIFSEELTRAGVKFVVAAVKDMLGSVRGKNGMPSP